MAVLVIVDDLIFRSRIVTAASHLPASIRLTDAASMPAARSTDDWQLVIVDLNLESGDPIALIRHLRGSLPSTPIVGFFSHVQVELQQRAQEAGCSVVMPRSAFVRVLPQLLLGELPPSA